MIPKHSKVGLSGASAAGTRADGGQTMLHNFNALGFSECISSQALRFITLFTNISNALPVPMTRDDLRAYNITNTE
jgi:hypothetical protein